MEIGALITEADVGWLTALAAIQHAIGDLMLAVECPLLPGAISSSAAVRCRWFRFLSASPSRSMRSRASTIARGTDCYAGEFLAPVLGTLAPKKRLFLNVPRKRFVETLSGKNRVKSINRVLPFRTAGFPRYGWKAGYQVAPSR